MPIIELFGQLKKKKKFYMVSVAYAYPPIRNYKAMISVFAAYV